MAVVDPIERRTVISGAGQLIKAGAGSLVLAVALFAGDALVARRRRTEAES